MGFFSKCSEAIENAAASVERDVVAAARAAGSVIEKAAAAARSFVHSVVAATVSLAKKAADAAVQAGKWIAKTAAEVYSAAKKAFNAAKAAVTTFVCRAAEVAKKAAIFVEDEIVNAAVTAIAGAMTTPVMEAALRKMAATALPPKALQDDGKKTGCATCCTAPVGQPPPCKCGPGGGVERADCKSPLGHAHYVNGINTDMAAHCTTLRALAKATCLEFTGTFNATGGTPRDLIECLDNIQRAGTTPDVALGKEIWQNVENDQDMTIYAHSQGGLVTQSALNETKLKLATNYSEEYFPDRAPTDAEKDAMDEYIDNKMSHIKVVSFGTAVLGWPTGPSYENFTNLSDPVPRAILAAQSNNADKLAGTEAAPAHLFVSPHLNPIDSHSMDGVYIPQLERTHPANCACFPSTGASR